MSVDMGILSDFLIFTIWPFGAIKFREGSSVVKLTE